MIYMTTNKKKNEVLQMDNVLFQVLNNYFLRLKSLSKSKFNQTHRTTPVLQIINKLIKCAKLLNNFKN